MSRRQWTSLDLAREFLWLLVDGGKLRPVERDRLVTYRTYYLPAIVALELPDRDRYLGLLDPSTRSAHAAQLVGSILNVATVEDRDGWVVRDPELHLYITHSRDRHCHVRPVDDDAQPGLLEPQPETPPRAPPLPILEVRVEHAAQPVVVDSGGGMFPLARGPWRPRITLFAPADGPPYLLSAGRLTLLTQDGRSQEVAPHQPALLVHNGNFVATAQRGHFWQRRTGGSFELLGVARAARPPLLVYQPSAERLVWDRNERPVLPLPDASAPQITLQAAAGDLLRAEVESRSTTELLYFDGQPLEMPSEGSVFIHGAHLRGVRLEGQTPAIRIRSNHPTAPACFELRAAPHTGHLGRTTPSEPIFGFEAPFASVFQDGVRLTTKDAPDELVRAIEIASRSLRGPVARIAIDGLEGCKLMPLCSGLELDGQPLRREVWRWCTGVATLTVTGLRLRLEATEPGRVGVMFEQPRLVGTLSRDPENGWRTHGWRLAPITDGLSIDGHSRHPLRVDGRTITEPTTLPGSYLHRIELDTGVYRLLGLEAGTPLETPAEVVPTLSSRRAKPAALQAALGSHPRERET